MKTNAMEPTTIPVIFPPKLWGANVTGVSDGEDLGVGSEFDFVGVASARTEMDASAEEAVKNSKVSTVISGTETTAFVGRKQSDKV